VVNPKLTGNVQQIPIFARPPECFLPDQGIRHKFISPDATLFGKAPLPDAIVPGSSDGLACTFSPYQ